MNLAARTLQEAAKNGFKRLRNFRGARLLFIKAYAGQYYDRSHGVLGDEPLNLAFTAIRALVPNLITRNPKNMVESEYLMYRPYGKLLALGLDLISKRLKLPETLQRGLVDAIFTMGIFKVGLMNSNSLVYFGEDTVDPGTLYVDTVDFDDFTFDPATRQLRKASFLGEKIRVERDEILASGLYDNAMIEKLPSSMEVLNSQKSVRDLSASQLNQRLTDKLHDSIDLLELWLPDPDVIVTLPFMSSTNGKFLREESFNGPEDGPYAFLTLTPPVPDNPIPVQLAGIWHDLHTMGNRIAKKTLDQAEAQKDILGYQRQYADDAQEIVDAKNLDAVAMQDPAGAQMFSFGGQNPQNERMTAQILQWFDQFSGNTSLLGGTQVQTNVATVANIMSQNALTGVMYMKDQAYRTTKEVLQKCAWYLHTDPLIRLPLIQRDVIPAEYDITDEEIRMISPARVQETQIFLTPEVRRGDFLDFAFNIEQDSMAPINAQARLQQLNALAINIIPAAASAAQVCAQMGTPFSFERFVVRIAKLMGLDWIDEIFQSPELVASMMRMARQGPQPQNSKGIASPAAIRQNQGAVTGQTPPVEETRQRQEAQVGAAQGQAELPIKEL
jgi:hypothetical protein